MVEIAVPLGALFSLLVFDAIGLAAGGILVPGYVALALDQPARLLPLLGLAFATRLVTAGIGRFTFLFGRRQLVMSVLVGCLLARAFYDVTGLPSAALAGHGFDAVGWVLPGLVGYWFARQGIVDTLAALTLTSVLVRLSLLLLAGPVLPA